MCLWKTRDVSNLVGAAPPGWYPDPSGGRQWRVWNGHSWTDVTRSYATPAAVTNVERADLTLIGALHRLTQFGVLAYYGGFALLVSLLAHWPGQPEPVSVRFANATLGAAVGLTLIGTISFAVTVRALRGRWSIDAVIPLANSFVASYLMSARIGVGGPQRRVAADVFITVGFVVLCPREPWVGVALAGVAFTQLARVYVLSDLLSDPDVAPTSAS